jgi:hypothetical protein
MATNRQCLGILVALFLILNVSSLELKAQTATTGALSGTVTDATGAVVANATVTVSSTSTSQTRSAMTGSDGSYKVGLLPPGNYRVKFEISGFNAAEVPSVAVNVTETAVLNQSLTVGSQSQAVEVQAEAVTVQTSDATVGTVMLGQAIAELPLTSRNYTNLLGLTAGSNVGVFNAANVGKGTQDIAVNGGATTDNNFLQDGAPIELSSGSGSAVDAGGNSGIAIANPDAIQEFKIQTSMFDAGYGRKPGANVNVITKSGTNDFHGTAFEFFRNTALNANGFFRNSTPAPNNTKQVLNQNQYGGVFGGPVKKDKLFFFASYQETSQKNGIAVQGYATPTLPPIPTGDRSNTAAFKAALGATFCPTVAQGGTCPSATGGKTSNGGIQVLPDGSNINPVALNILQLKNPDGTYFIPSSTNGLYQNTTYSIPTQYAENQALGNVDYVIDAKNTLSLRWMYSADPTLVPFGSVGGSSTSTTPSNYVPGSAGHYEFTANDSVLRITSVLSNTLVNEAHASLQRIVSNIYNLVPFTNEQVGISSIIPQINGLDQIAVTGQFTVGTWGATALSQRNNTSWEIADNLSWSRGKQTIRTGFEFERDRVNQNLKGDSYGVETFQTFQDFLLGLPGCAPGTSGSLPTQCNAANPGGTNGTPTSNLSNTGTTATITGPQGVYVAYREPAGSAYVQDDVKFSSRLTMNFGVRWEYNGLVASHVGQLTNAWPSLIKTVPIPGSSPATGTLAGFVVPSNYNPAFVPPPTVGGLFQNNQTIGTRNGIPLTDFAPRVGVAWQPLNSDRFVVRSGFGYFYDRVTQANYTTTYYIAQPYATFISKSGPANYFATEAQPYAPTPLAWQPRWVNFANGTSSNLSEYIQGENYLTPLLYEWNLNIQYEVRPTWVVEIGYVGSHGIHQIAQGRLINQAELVGSPTAANAPGIAAGLVPFNTVANAALRVPYLGFAPTGLIDATTGGDNKFNSFQATLRKTISHGLSFQAAYTWSKSLTTGNLTTNDANNPGSQYGLNPSYRPQRLTINYAWDLPLGYAEGLKGKLVNGWNLSGVTIVQGGTPLTVTDSRGGSIYGFGAGTGETSTAEFCPGMSAANAGTAGGVESRLGGLSGGPGYLNKNAFCTTPPIGDGTGYGNSPLGLILGPGQFNWDMSLVKTTRVGGIREDATLQFRTEFFNAFNHAQFNNPTVLDVSKSTFGQITSTSVSPRLIQFALKYAF